MIATHPSPPPPPWRRYDMTFPSEAAAIQFLKVVTKMFLLKYQHGMNWNVPLGYTQAKKTSETVLTVLPNYWKMQFSALIVALNYEDCSCCPLLMSQQMCLGSFGLSRFSKQRLKHQGCLQPFLLMSRLSVCLPLLLLVSFFFFWKWW